MGNLDKCDDDKGLLRHVALASINLAKIKGDKKFSAKLLAEIDGDLEHLDVATLTREYIEALGGVHDGLRKLLNGALAEWKSTVRDRSEEHTSELQSLMRSSYAVFCLKNKKH